MNAPGPNRSYAGMASLTACGVRWSQTRYGLGVLPRRQTSRHLPLPATAAVYSRPHRPAALQFAGLEGNGASIAGRSCSGYPVVPAATGPSENTGMAWQATAALRREPGQP